MQDRAIRTYSLSIDQETVRRMLGGAYAALVEASGHMPEGLPEDKLASVAGWLCGQGKPGLLLYGSYGTGKTTMLRAVYYTATQLGRTVMIHTAKSAVATGTQEMRKDRSLLLIDELGREQIERKDYGNVSEPLVDLICYREDRGLPTLLVTNLTDRQLEEKYGKYVYDRLRGSYSRVYYEGRSYR